MERLLVFSATSQWSGHISEWLRIAFQAVATRPCQYKRRAGDFEATSLQLRQRANAWLLSCRGDSGALFCNQWLDIKHCNRAWMAQGWTAHDTMAGDEDDYRDGTRLLMIRRTRLVTILLYRMYDRQRDKRVACIATIPRARRD